MRGKNSITAISVLVGACIGAGVLGIPYVASKSGFLIALIYIVVLGAVMLFTNLCIGEVSLRTRDDHQLVGYAEKYLGMRGRRWMEFATIFGIYAAIIAYLVGVGDSLSFLIFGNMDYSVLLGVLFGGLMSLIIWNGLGSLKQFERAGVFFILILMLIIFFIFIGDVNLANLAYLDKFNFLLPFGVVLFALMSFHAIPEVSLVLGNGKAKLKKVLFWGTIISIIFYILFTLVVVGFKGFDTPQIATLALGSIFVVLGILTMFTSYLALGNALQEDFIFDDHFLRRKSWVLSAVVPIFLYLVVSFFDFFSFTKILSIGGVVSGGIIAVLSLLMTKKAKIQGDRKPEYSVPLSWVVIILFVLIFAFGVVREVFLALR